MFQRNLIHLKIRLHHYWNASIGGLAPLVPCRGGCPAASRNEICGGGWESGRPLQMNFQRPVGSRGAFTDKFTPKFKLCLWLHCAHIFLYFIQNKKYIIVNMSSNLIYIYTHMFKCWTWGWQSRTTTIVHLLPTLLPLIPGAGTTMGFIPGIKVIILVPTGATSRAFI